MTTKTPICAYSRQYAGYVCISEGCLEYPFICTSCRDHECSFLHVNCNQKEGSIVNWPEIRALMKTMMASTQESQMLLEMKQKVDQIISGIRSALDSTISNIMSHKLILKPQIEETLKSLQCGNFDKLKPKTMAHFYRSIKNKTHFVNKETLKQDAVLFGEFITQLQAKSRQFYQSKLNKSLSEEVARLSKNQTKILEYTKIIEHNHNDSLAYFNRAINYQAINKLEDALKDYQRGLQIDPNDCSAYNNRGNLYKLKNMMAQAQAEYTQAIKLNPNYANAYNNRANLYDDVNLHEKAELDYKRAIELDPKYSDAYYNLAILYEKMHRQELALDNYTKAINLNCDDHEYYNSRGELYKNLNRLEEALEDLTKAISLKPDEAQYYVNRLQVYKRMNNQNEISRNEQVIARLFWGK